jgi:hypothetical protein
VVRFPEYTIKPVKVVAVTGNDMRTLERAPAILAKSLAVAIIDKVIQTFKQ